MKLLLIATCLILLSFTVNARLLPHSERSALETIKTLYSHFDPTSLMQIQFEDTNSHRLTIGVTDFINVLQYSNTADLKDSTVFLHFFLNRQAELQTKIQQMNSGSTDPLIRDLNNRLIRLIILLDIYDKSLTNRKLKLFNPTNIKNLIAALEILARKEVRDISILVGYFQKTRKREIKDAVNKFQLIEGFPRLESYLKVTATDIRLMLGEQIATRTLSLKIQNGFKPVHEVVRQIELLEAELFCRSLFQ